MNLVPILAAEGGLSEIPGKIADQFGLNWWLFISQCISFCIVAYCLQRWAYHPILAQLHARRDRIAESMQNADKIKVQLAEAQQASQEILAKASAEAQKIIEETRAAAKSIGERESQRALAEAQQIIAKAQEATDMERAKMLVELKREVARLVIDTTAKVTGKVLSTDDQRRLSEETAREIAA